MIFRAVVDSGRASARRTSSSTPASNIARVRALDPLARAPPAGRRARRSSSAGACRLPRAGRRAASAPPRRARAPGRPAAGRSGARLRPPRDRRSASSACACSAPPRRRRAPSARGRRARAPAERRARRAQPGSTGRFRRRRPGCGRRRAPRRSRRARAPGTRRPTPRGRAPRSRRGRRATGWSGSAGPGRAAPSRPQTRSAGIRRAIASATALLPLAVGPKIASTLTPSASRRVSRWAGGCAATFPVGFVSHRRRDRAAASVSGARPPSSRYRSTPPYRRSSASRTACIASPGVAAIRSIRARSASSSAEASHSSCRGCEPNCAERVVLGDRPRPERRRAAAGGPRRARCGPCRRGSGRRPAPEPSATASTASRTAAGSARGSAGRRARSPRCMRRRGVGRRLISVPALLVEVVEHGHVDDLDVELARRIVVDLELLAEVDDPASRRLRASASQPSRSEQADAVGPDHRAEARSARRPRSAGRRDRGR